MKKIYSFILLLSVMFCAQSVSAQGLYVDYCGNNIPTGTTGYVNGMVGNTTYELAIHLTPAELQKYVGCKITKVVYGISQTTSVTSGLKMTGWVRNASDSMGANLVEGETEVKLGWNVITLSQPYEITATSDIYLGVSYAQKLKEKIVCYAGESNVNGCFTRRASATKWSDWSNKGWGSLCLRAYVEGESLPTHDLALKNVVLGHSLTKVGSTILVKGTVVNNASAVASKPQIVCSVDGAQTYTYQCKGDLAYEQTENFSIEVPNNVSDENTHKVTLEVKWADGSADQAAHDNVAQLDVQFANKVYYRKMVVEEGTGTWCGFCVRGYVAMKMMAEEHPDRFLGIAVHCGDEMSYGPYDNWISTVINESYPGCIINRDGNIYDPNYEELTYVMGLMDDVAKAGISVSGVIDETSNKVLMTAEVTPSYSATGEDLRVAFVIREDGYVAKQKNYYAGGSYGPMYGFETMSSICALPMYDVARIIVPTMEGEKGSIPSSIQKDQTYKYSYVVDIPSSVTDKANINVAAILIDGKTGAVLNGEAAKFVPGTVNDSDAINAISADAAKHNGAMFDLSGRRVDSARRGIYVQDGKLRLVK